MVWSSKVRASSVSQGCQRPVATSEALTLILPPPRRPDPLARLQARWRAAEPTPRRLVLRAPGDGPEPRHHLFPSLYLLLPLDAIRTVLRLTGCHSQRQRRLPAREVVWLVIAGSLFRGRSLPMVWRHLHPGSDDPEPADSSFTRARQRPGALPM